MKSIIVNGRLRRIELTTEEMKNITTLKPDTKLRRDAYIKKNKRKLKI